MGRISVRQHELCVPVLCCVGMVRRVTFGFGSVRTCSAGVWSGGGPGTEIWILIYKGLDSV